MKTVTLPAFNRPRYLEHTLNSLSKNNLLGFDIMYINIDSKNEEVIDLCKSINFIQTDIRINETTLGVRRNPFDVINRAFDNGSSFNVHIEDDILLSKDTFDLARWYFENIPEDKYLLLNFCNYFNDSKNLPNKVVEYDEFIAIGFCFFAFSWYQFIKPFWFKDHIIKKSKNVGWDWTVRDVIRKYNLKTLTSLIPRVEHIGLVGTHCSVGSQRDLFYDTKCYRGNPIEFTFNGDTK